MARQSERSMQHSKHSMQHSMQCSAAHHGVQVAEPTLPDMEGNKPSTAQHSRQRSAPSRPGGGTRSSG